MFSLDSLKWKYFRKLKYLLEFQIDFANFNSSVSIYIIMKSSLNAFFSFRSWAFTVSSRLFKACSRGQFVERLLKAIRCSLLLLPHSKSLMLTVIINITILQARRLLGAEASEDHPKVFPMPQCVKNLSAVQKTWVRSPGGEDTLEEEMAILQYSCLENPWQAIVRGVTDLGMTEQVSTQSTS